MAYLSPHALIVDSSPLFNAPLAQYLAEKGFTVSIVEHPSEAIEVLRKNTYELVAIGKAEAPFPFLELCALTKELQQRAKLLILGKIGEKLPEDTRFHNGEMLTLKRPFSLYALEELFVKLRQLKAKTENSLVDIPELPPFFIAKSPAMLSIARELLSIANSKAHVFLTGESGTGKEVIAETIHALSPRKEKPFVKINCAAIPETLIESEFFGHEKGAFTGALIKKLGRLELSHEGTLLLDEITESPLCFQAKLLRAVELLQFERVGGSSTLEVDVRFISTSNRDLQTCIAQKLLREDLFYRLHVIPIHIPPLRERKEDILPLAQHFLELFCKENQKPFKALSSSAMDFLSEEPWPGNVRELSNLIERISIMHKEDVIEADHLRWKHPMHKDLKTSPSQTTLAELEKKTILETLSSQKNNRSITARKLGISVRTLRNKLKDYDH